MPLAPDPGSPSPARAVIPRSKLFSWPALLLAGVLGALALWGGSRLYLDRRDRMLFAAASRAVDSRDFPSAWFWLQRLYRVHPDNLATNRLIAQFEAARRSPEELGWRVNVIRIGPATLDDYLSWAAAALRLGQTATALEALDHVPSQWRDDPSFHELLAGAYAADGQLQAADYHFAAAARIEPSNPVHLANLSALRLTCPDAQIRQAARDTLEHFAATTAPLLADRALLTDALQQGDVARIARFRAAMLQQPHRTLDDELSCIAAAPARDVARSELASLWKAVLSDPIQALQVAEWMMRRNDSTEALAWLRKLPAAEQSDIGIQTGQADALTAIRDWPGLRSYLTGKNWHDCDFLRVALLVRAARESSAPAPVWRDAIAACHGNPSDLLLLAQSADSWSWQPESETLYWQISLLGYPARGPALKALWKFYTASGNTPGLLRVAREQYTDSPSSLSVCNNFAFLSLLTGIGASDAARIAGQDFEKDPENPNVAATYAYSLYIDGRYNDGLRVLNRFGEHRMQAAGATLYLALLQQAAGDGDAATRSASVIDVTKLLPEEKLLLQKIPSKTSAVIPLNSSQYSNN